MKSFYRFENRWILTATLRVKTAVSIGSRASLMPAGSDLPVIKTPEGIPFIPGSSLKGVIRTFTERVLRTADELNRRQRREGLWACDPLDEMSRCITNEKKEDLLEEAKKATNRIRDETFAELIWKESCTACRLFGSQWLASRISFQDAMLSNQGGMLRLTEVRDGVGIDRDLGSARPRIKYDFETVPRGAAFKIRIIAENADEWEIGLLALALETIGRGELPVGGKTTRGVGWGELTELKIQCISQEHLLDYLIGKAQPTPYEPQNLIQRLSSQLQTQGGLHA